MRRKVARLSWIGQRGISSQVLRKVSAPGVHGLIGLDHTASNNRNATELVTSLQVLLVLRWTLAGAVGLVGVVGAFGD